MPDFSPEIVKKFGGDTPHNELFHFGIQVGILGMLFVMFFYFNLVRKAFHILVQKKLKSETLAISLFSLTWEYSYQSLANDVILAGRFFAILITAFIDKIYNNEKSISI